ncbi:colicin V production protein [Sphingomonas sp. Leaf412]|uniref:CvpA family protein n=1 Tax=Sphingomonas sp. Leaf412 TaxID=1736370 RepID=UPI0006FB19E7|nr:CvpA family protein [Sphingomonas sp. Leaf412]KQT32421.1 colicin V production protein [Sphingomonas sp. Leaf412]
MNLQGLDIIVLIVVGATALLGVKRGFVAEVLALFAWVAMVFAIKAFHLPLSARLADPVGSSSGAAVLAFVILAGGTYFLGKIVVNAIGKRTRTSVLGPIDRALGFGFGALKGLILSSLAYILLTLVLDTLGAGPKSRPTWITQARTYPLLRATSGAIADFVDRRRKGEPVFGDDTRAAGNGT